MVVSPPLGRTYVHTCTRATPAPATKYSIMVAARLILVSLWPLMFYDCHTFGHSTTSVGIPSIDPYWYRLFSRQLFLRNLFLDIHGDAECIRLLSPYSFVVHVHTNNSLAREYFFIKTFCRSYSLNRFSIYCVYLLKLKKTCLILSQYADIKLQRLCYIRFYNHSEVELLAN